MKAMNSVGKASNPLWDRVKERYDLGVELRRPYEREWVINLAFLTGKHYVFFNTHTHTLHQIQQLKGRIRNIDNKILPRWRRQVADLIKNKPEMSVVPKTHEDEDIKAAKTGNKALKHFWRQDNMLKKLRMLASWMFATGTAFLDDRWDEKLGQITINPETGDPEYSGDATCSVWNPFEVLVPYTCIGGDSHHVFPWLMKSKWRTLEELVHIYGSNAKKIPGEKSAVPSVDLNSLFGLGSGTATMKVPGAMEMSYYEKPNPITKKGQFVIGANGVILDKQDYPFTDYNIEVFKDIEIPGIFWGKATLAEAIGLQRTWNRTLSSIDEYNRVMAKGKGMIPRGANMEYKPDDRHGEWFEYTPIYGHKPEHLDVKGLPSTYPLIMQYTYEAFEDLFSQHEVSRGTNKSDIRSGEMVSLLREQDAHGNIPAHSIFEESLEAVMTRVLKRMQAGYKDERMLRIVGREGEFEILAFKGADLNGNTDVMVKKQSSLPESRQARQSIIESRFERGLYGDPTDPEVRRHVMNMLDDAIVEDIYSDTRRDESYARFENQIMLEGKIEGPELINSYDDHAVHVREHKHEQKSMEYQKLKLQDPEHFALIDQIFLSHKMAHKEFLDEEMDRMIAQQTQMQGGNNGAPNRNMGQIRK